MHKTRRRIAGGPEEAQKRAMRRQATTAEVQENDRDKRQRRRGRRQTTKTTTKMTPTTKKTMHQISGVVNRIPLDSLRSPRRPLGTSEDSKKLIRITKNNNIQSLWKFTVCCLLGPSQGVLLELSWGFLGASWAVLRPSWAILERSSPFCSLLGALGPSRKSSWTFLSPLGAYFEAILRPTWAILGLSWADLLDYVGPS